MSLYEITLNTLDGKPLSLAAYKGKVVLAVNVASECGYTPQYAGLQKLYEEQKDRGLVVLGFPCNQFGGQEPGAEADIKTFCETTYGVSFPLFAKIKVNGPDAHPLYQFLTQAQPGLLGTRRIKWNFTKFLVDREGRPLKRYAPADKPETLEADIQRALAGP